MRVAVPVPATLRRLKEVAAFTEAMARLEADVTLSVSDKATAIYQQLVMSLDQLRVRGQLDPLVEEQLVTLADASVAAVAGIHAELGAGLARELASFTPAPPTLREKFAHWWRDDRW